MKRLFRKINASLTVSEKIVFFFVYLSLLGTLIFLAVQVFLAPARPDVEYDKGKGDYALPILQTVGALVLINLPIFLECRFTLEVPTPMSVAYVLFLYCSVYLGEFRSFYYHVPYWDKILHTFSGAMLGAVSFSVISALVGDDLLKKRPLLLALFSFCFALAVGVLWEIYEYALDFAGDLNMQKYADAAGNAFAGRAALADTMEDLIVDAFGALLASLIGYLSLKRKSKLYDKLLIRKAAAAPPGESLGGEREEAAPQTKEPDAP